MRCPVCLDSELDPIIHHGIEIDRCGRCRGTWLDRGELEKLLDLAEARSPKRPSDGRDDERRGREPSHDRSTRRGATLDRADRDRMEDEHRQRGSKRSKKKKRTSAFAELLEDVFDVLD